MHRLTGNKAHSAPLLWYTVNSRHSGHPRDHDLVSVIARAGVYFSQTSVTFVGDLAAVRNSGVSVIARCPQGGS